MRLLLDTQIFLWAVMGSAKLKAGARKTMGEADEIYVSSASIWEIAIKSGLGKLNADTKLIVAAIGESGFMELPVYSRHAVMVSELPPHHRDPFDRLLLAQAMSEPLQLLTTDTTLAKYSELVRVI
ncbi:MAG: type II toxin-antitoxin system VapC family toxin [Nitrosomonadales bacterium]|nr:type II toxin-antitoxin system VapC family toxin [Nitrosomonadales bacterium]